MSFYIVRTIENQLMVGFFNAQNTATLFDVVDEEVDPFACEYLKLPNGSGVFLDGHVREQAPEELEDGEAPDIVATITGENGSESGRVSEAVMDALQEKSWKQFTRGDFERAYGIDLTQLGSEEKVKSFGAHMGLNIPA